MKIKKKKKVAAPAASASASGGNPRQFKSADSIFKPDMIAFHFWREWFRARDRNDWPLVYSMIAENTPLHQRVGTLENFHELCRRRDLSVPGLRDGELRKIRLDGPDVAQMYRVRGLDDRVQREVTVERWRMLRDMAGWAIYGVDEVTKQRDELREHGIDASWFDPFEIPEGFVGRDVQLKDAQDAIDAGDIELPV